MPFEKNVFVNCPFDEEYLPLLRPLLFTVIYLGLKPRIALEGIDSGELRLHKIVELIRESQFSIHDLSRAEAAAPGELHRLNMPFELGIDFGCRVFGRPRHRQKRTLVLERSLTATSLPSPTWPARTSSVTIMSHTRSSALFETGLRMLAWPRLLDLR